MGDFAAAAEAWAKAATARQPPLTPRPLPLPHAAKRAWCQGGKPARLARPASSRRAGRHPSAIRSRASTAATSRSSRCARARPRLRGPEPGRPGAVRRRGADVADARRSRTVPALPGHAPRPVRPARRGGRPARVEATVTRRRPSGGARPGIPRRIPMRGARARKEGARRGGRRPLGVPGRAGSRGALPGDPSLPARGVRGGGPRIRARRPRGDGGGRAQDERRARASPSAKSRARRPRTLVPRVSGRARRRRMAHPGATEAVLTAVRQQPGAHVRGDRRPDPDDHPAGEAGPGRADRTRPSRQDRAHARDPLPPGFERIVLV